MLIRHHVKRGVSRSQHFEEYVESRLEKLLRIPFSVSKVDVTSLKEGSFYTVELVVKGTEVVRASASTNDFGESFDRAFDKCLKQITKMRLIHGKEHRRQKRKMGNKVHKIYASAKQKKAA